MNKSIILPRVNFILFLFSILFSVAMLTNEGLAEDSNELPVLRVLIGASNSNVYINEKGEFIGSEIDKVKGYLDKSGLLYEFQILPWARALREMETRNDTISIEVARTKDREEKFHWLLLTTEYNNYLLSRKSLEMANLNKKQILEGDYTAICVLNSYQCNALAAFGFSDDRLVKVGGLNIVEQTRMVLRNRIDFILSDLSALNRQFKSLGHDMPPLTLGLKVLTMKAYLVSPKTINPLLLQKLLRVKK